MGMVWTASWSKTLSLITSNNLICNNTFILTIPFLFILKYKYACVLENKFLLPKLETLFNKQYAQGAMQKMRESEAVYPPGHAVHELAPTPEIDPEYKINNK